MSSSASAGADDVVAPRLLHDDGVAFPQQAIGERFLQATTVAVLVEVDAQGIVTNAAVESPQGHGFDEAAVTAALHLKFAPATRDGNPLAAKIRFRYVFTPPPSRLEVMITTTAARPLTGASLVVESADGAREDGTANGDGSWRSDHLKPGRVHVAVRAEGYEPFASDVDLSPGEVSRVVFRLNSNPPAVPPRESNTAADAGDAVVEVTVKGPPPTREVTKRTMTRDEIAVIPGARGDALTALQSMPGVGHSPPLSGLLIMRGSAPQDTHVYADGTDIPTIYHLGGLSSVIPTELLERLDFYPGNFGAEYGRGTGGVVDASIRDPKKDDRYHGMAQLDFLEGRLIVEGPVAAGWRFLAAGRYSWFNLWLDPILQNSGGTTTAAPRYYDYQVEIQKDIDARQSFRILFFGSHDALDFFTNDATNSNFSGNVSNATSFFRVQARYVNRISPVTALSFTAAVGHDTSAAAFGPNYVNIAQTPLSARASLSQKVVDRITLRTGFDLVYSPYDATVLSPKPPSPGEPGPGRGTPPFETTPSGTRFLPGAFVDATLTPWRGALIVPGLRGDYDDGTKTWDVAPRINVRQDLSRGFPRTTLKAGVGEYFQPPQQTDLDPVFGQPNLTSSRAVHYDAGVEHQFTRQLELSVDAFYKALDRLIVVNDGNAGQGRAYGVEWLLRYSPDRRFFGWIAYTLSRSERRDSSPGPWYPFQYDETHNLSVVTSYKIDDHWRVGARFRFTTGDPYTPNGYGPLDASNATFVAVPGYPAFGARLPPFHELDVRVDRVFHIGRVTLTAYLDVENIYSYGAPAGISSNYNFTQQQYAKGLPILPALGLRGEL